MVTLGDNNLRPMVVLVVSLFAATLMTSPVGQALPRPEPSHVVIENNLSPAIGGGCTGSAVVTYAWNPIDYASQIRLVPDASCKLVPTWYWDVAVYGPMNDLKTVSNVVVWSDAGSTGLEATFDNSPDCAARHMGATDQETYHWWSHYIPPNPGTRGCLSFYEQFWSHIFDEAGIDVYEISGISEDRASYCGFWPGDRSVDAWYCSIRPTVPADQIQWTADSTQILTSVLPGTSMEFYIHPPV